MSKKKLALMVPTAGGDVKMRTAHGLMETCVMCMQNHIDISLYYTEGHCYIDQARNFLVYKALSEGCTHFLFIDADIEFTAKDVAMLLHDSDNGKEIVCGIYRVKKDEPTAACRLAEAPDAPMVDGCFRVLTGAPTGFLLFTRAVLENPKLKEMSPAFVASFQGQPVMHKYFETAYPIDKETGAPTFTGEDIFFTNKVRKAGYTVWADCRIDLGHIGTKIYRFDIGAITEDGHVANNS